MVDQITRNCARYCLILFSTITYDYMPALSQTVTAQVLTAFPTDNFMYDGKSTPNYGLKFVNDTWQPVAPTGWFSGYGGMKFFTSGQRRLSIHANGTLEASNPLIMAPAAAANNYIQFKNNGTNLAIMGSSGSIYGNNPDNFGLSVYGSGNLEFSTANTKQMVITNSGYIGIGTSVPTEKLSVKGKIRAQELKIESSTTGNWPDYVFKPTYKLTPLPELEQFIKTHQHLPEVPSAKQVAANGIEVGANQALLLKKIEELTLHMIEMNKNVEVLNNKVNQLELENIKLKRRLNNR